MRRWLTISIAVILVTAIFVYGIRQPKVQPTPEQQFRTALSSLESGGTAGVSEALRTLNADERYRDQAILLSAVVALHADDPSRAYQKLFTLDQNGPLRHLSMLYAAQALYEMDQFAEAEILLRTLKSEQPDNPEARRWLAAVYYDLGAFDAAIVELEHLISLRPDDYKPHRLIGIMQRDFEQEEDAITHYKRALELNPPEPAAEDIRQQLARALIAVQRHQEALDVFRNSPAPATDTGAARNLILASCYRELGDITRARELLQTAIKGGTDSAELVILDAALSADDGKNSEAAQKLLEGVSRFPFDAELRYACALQLQKAGDTAGADEQLAKWEKYRALAVSRTELNVKAIQEPYNADVRDELARVSDALGQKELAEVWRRAAAALRARQSAGDLPRSADTEQDPASAVSADAP